MTSGAARPEAVPGAVVVAIDGPAGSGKSTIAGALAARLGVPHVDTGAYYRAAALVALRGGVDVDDADAVVGQLVRATLERRGGRTFVDGIDVEDEVRGPAVTAVVSRVARHPQVRAALVVVQRAAVGLQGAVVEGRDAGTVVVPAAVLKVWLTATAAERAARRAGQIGADDLPSLEADLEARDRADAPNMVPAPDALIVDTTGRSVSAIVDDLVEHLRARRPRDRLSG